MLARQLAEALADGVLPWDLHEQYGVVDPVYHRRRASKEPKYTGMVGPRFDAALDKGYVDLGLVAPEVAKERLITQRQFTSKIAEKVTHILMHRDEAYIRDPDGIMKIADVDPKAVATMVREEMRSYFSEEESYARERDDDSVDGFTKAEQEAARAIVSVQPVQGKTGAGFKFVMKPTFAEINKRARG